MPGLTVSTVAEWIVDKSNYLNIHQRSISSIVNRDMYSSDHFKNILNLNNQHYYYLRGFLNKKHMLKTCFG